MNHSLPQLIKLTFFSLSIFAGSTFAKSPPIVEQIQAPNCLANKFPSSYKTLASNNSFKIVEVPSSQLDKVVLLADQVRCGRFINLSAHFESPTLSKENVAKSLLAKLEEKKVSTETTQEKYAISHEKAVNELIEKVDSSRIIETLTKLTSYHNRSATTQRGVQVAEWLKSAVDELAKTNHRNDVMTYFVETGRRYQQPSMVSVIGKDLKGPGIVLGAHMDTLDGFMPGAGDDGSGSSSLMEVARLLMSSDLTFKSPIYLIWYAAEERGLVGSQYVVKHFKKNNIPVKAVVQFDMTGYRNDQNDTTMWVFKDYTDKALTKYIAELITTYVKVPVRYSKCGYGCSDHASWTDVGIPAAFPCETSFEDHNPHIHTSRDTMDLLTTEHMVNFSKLGLAFAVELASE